MKEDDLFSKIMYKRYLIDDFNNANVPERLRGSTQDRLGQPS